MNGLPPRLSPRRPPSVPEAPRAFDDLRASGSLDWNLAIHKNFSIVEHLRAQLG